MESEEESESSDDEVSSATEVSTDSEFAREECTPACPTSPPAILVTEATPPAPPPHAPGPPAPPEYPLSRTRSAGGLATKRALELKRKYLLGEPSPPSVRKSDSTSQLDTKLEAFRSNITEIQKLLNPAPAQPQKPIVTFQITEENKFQPMPDIIKNLCSDAPVDLLTKGDSPLCKSDWREPIKEEKKEPDIELDSLSEEDSSHTETMPNQPVPRVEVHDEGGELIQLDSLTIISNGLEDNDEKASGTATTTGPTVLAADSESSESCRDATTLALTETELSDWAAESAVLDDCGFEDRDDRKRSKNPRSLSGPKMVHETKNISAIASHVCGRTSPEPIVFSNALEHFEFADEGDQDPFIETPTTPRNEGFMELMDNDYDPYFPTNDRSMNFIERTFSETTTRPNEVVQPEEEKPSDFSDVIKFIDDQDSKTESVSKGESEKSVSNVETPQNDVLDKSNTSSDRKEDSLIKVSELSSMDFDADIDLKRESTSISDASPPLEDENGSKLDKIDDDKLENETSLEDISPPLASEKSKSQSSLTYSNLNKPISFTNPCSIRLYAPAICRSASETFTRPNIRLPVSVPQNTDFNLSYHLSSDSVSTPSPSSRRDTIEKVHEIKKEREEQTEVVRRLVLERLGSNGQRANKKCPRRSRPSPLSSVPPPVPPPPVSPPVPPLPPPSPPPPLAALPVAPSLSDPDLTHERRRKGIMRSISNYFNRRLGPRQKVILCYTHVHSISKALKCIIIQ